MKTLVVGTFTDPALLRSPDFIANSVSIKLFETAPTRVHRFKVGETRKLVGLVNFPEFNGQTVKIVGVREDGEHGRAYYIEGKINVYVNWVYEYRLE